MSIEAWEIEDLERMRRVREELQREFLEIPLAPPFRPRPVAVERVPSICEVIVPEYNP
jgi:hypothetical protein